VLAHADDVTKNYLLIRDYQRRPEMSSRMQKLVDDVNYFSNAVWAHTTRSQLAVPLFGICMAGGLMALAPYIVDELNMSSGVFLAVLAATQQMGVEAEALFSALLQIQLSISALLKIYSLMNLPTDISERMLANRKQQERGRDVVDDSTLQARGARTDRGGDTNRGGSTNRGGGGTHRGGETNRGADLTAEAAPVIPTGHAAKFEADRLLIELLSVGLQPPEPIEVLRAQKHERYGRQRGTWRRSLSRDADIDVSSLSRNSQGSIAVSDGPRDGVGGGAGGGVGGGAGGGAGGEDDRDSRSIGAGRNSEDRDSRSIGSGRNSSGDRLLGEEDGSFSRDKELLLEENSQLPIEHNRGSAGQRLTATPRTHDTQNRQRKMQQRNATRRRMAALPLKGPLQDVNLSLAQGRIYAVVGAHGSGKSALLRLVAKAQHPTRGEVFVPPHLSIVHVEQQPQIVRHLSLYDNLTLGYKHGKSKPSIEHVCEVCASLGLTSHWLDFLRRSKEDAPAEESPSHAGAKLSEHAPSRTPIKSALSAKFIKAKKWMKHAGVTLNDVGKGATFQSSVRPQDAEKAAEQMLAGEYEEEEDADAWESHLSTSDRQILHIARAFITNPHLLVFHRPLANFDGALAQRVCATMRSFVTNRGSVQSGQGLLARTVIFSCSDNDVRAIETADAFITVGQPEGGANVHEASALPSDTETRVQALQRLNSAAARKDAAAPSACHLVSLPPRSASAGRVGTAGHAVASDRSACNGSQRTPLNARPPSLPARAFGGESGSAAAPALPEPQHLPKPHLVLAPSPSPTADTRPSPTADTRNAPWPLDVSTGEAASSRAASPQLSTSSPKSPQDDAGLLSWRPFARGGPPTDRRPPTDRNSGGAGWFGRMPLKRKAKGTDDLTA
jgi:ABC-type multidrug transport system fused ATPase/permease subunit